MTIGIEKVAISPRPRRSMEIAIVVEDPDLATPFLGSAFQFGKCLVGNGRREFVTESFFVVVHQVARAAEDPDILADVVVQEISELGQIGRHAGQNAGIRKVPDIVLAVHFHRQADLMEIRGALHAPGRLTGLLNGGQDQRHKYADYGNNDQELHERKGDLG